MILIKEVILYVFRVSITIFSYKGFQINQHRSLSFLKKGYFLTKTAVTNKLFSVLKIRFRCNVFETCIIIFIKEVEISLFQGIFSSKKT